VLSAECQDSVKTRLPQPRLNSNRQIPYRCCTVHVQLMSNQLMHHTCTICSISTMMMGSRRGVGRLLRAVQAGGPRWVGVTGAATLSTVLPGTRPTPAHRQGPCSHAQTHRGPLAFGGISSRPQVRCFAASAKNVKVSWSIAPALCSAFLCSEENVM
jgi:hypothetical protein